MQFIKSGPNIPDHLVESHEEGRVVFFCGSGVSYPAGLPGFKDLVLQIYSKLGEDMKPEELVAFNQSRFDSAIGLLEKRVTGNRHTVRGAVAQILEPAGLKRKAATQTHRALLTLASTRDSDPRVRLVTTNFDRVFWHVARSIPTLRAPWLPLPRKASWDGIAYLHGFLPNKPTNSDLDDLVLSSGDFGRAYLKERWASRFVSELFKNFTVCFVGYSIDDPVLRYMLDALSADALLGEAETEVFAFAGHETGKEEQAASEWRAKGVKPILFSQADNYAALHQTLRVWAESYRDGINGRTSIILKEAPFPPGDLADAGHIGRVLWALLEKSGDAAKAFAEIDPPAPIEWLDVLSSNRYDRKDLPLFGIYDHQIPRRPGDSERSPEFSFLSRPTSPSNMPWTELATRSVAWPSDNTTVYLSNWFAKHLAEPKAISWVANKGGKIHPQLAWAIWHRITTSSSSIPKPIIAIWSIICSDLATTAGLHGSDILSLADRFEKAGLLPSLKADLFSLLAPKVQFKEKIEWGRDGTPSPPERCRDYISWDVVLHAGSDAHHSLKSIFESKHWPALAKTSLSNFTDLLRQALDLMAQLGEASDREDPSYWHKPSIAEHAQNHDFYSWTVLIDACVGAWTILSKADPEIAYAEFVKWKRINYPVFSRLCLHVAANSRIIPDTGVEELLLRDGGWCLWHPYMKREVCRLFATRAPSLSRTSQSKILARICAKPPRGMFKSRNAKERASVMDAPPWVLLEKWKQSGAWMSPDATKRLAEIRKKHPKWILQGGDRDEFSSWMESGVGPWRTSKKLPRMLSSLMDALLTRKADDFFSEDDWQEICVEEPALAMDALLALAKKGNWPASVWRDSLQKYASENLAEDSLVTLGEALKKAPPALFTDAGHAVSWWLLFIAKATKSHERVICEIADKVFEAWGGETLPAKDDVVGTAINHPIGHATDSVIRAWYGTSPQAGDTIPALFKSRLSAVASDDRPIFQTGRTLLAAHLYSLFLVDPDWTRDNLLPRLSWTVSRQEAKVAWEGYLWSPRINRDLCLAFKDAFLATASHYDELGKHSQQYAGLLTWTILDIHGSLSTDECKAVLKALPAEGLAQVANTIANAVANRDQLESFLEHRVKPLFPGCWPVSNSKRSAAEAQAFAVLCVRTGDSFPYWAKVAEVFLRPTRNLYAVLGELEKSEICTKFPKEALKFLDRVVAAGSWHRDELTKCLAKISTAAPKLANTNAFKSLQRIAKPLL